MNLWIKIGVCGVNKSTVGCQIISQNKEWIAKSGNGLMFIASNGFKVESEMIPLLTLNSIHLWGYDKSIRSRTKTLYLELPSNAEAQEYIKKLDVALKEWSCSAFEPNINSLEDALY